MVETVERTAALSCSLAPKNPLPYWQQIKAIRTYHTGVETRPIEPRQGS